MKKKLIALLIAGTLALSPVNVYADAKDDKSQSLKQRFLTLKSKLRNSKKSSPNTNLIPALTWNPISWKRNYYPETE